MNRQRTVVFAGVALVATLALMPVPAASDGVTYAGNNDCGLVPPCIVPSCPVSTSIGGMVCWPGGHVPVDAMGGAAVTITDNVWVPVGGFVCQDLDTDLACGEIGELSETFCDAETFYTSVNAWNPNFPLYVFVGGLGLTSSECLTVFNTGTTGLVSHS